MSKYAAYGTVLEMGATGSAVEIAGVRNISGPELSLDTVDVTTHDSTGSWEEVVGTILRTGELTLEIIYDPADDTHDATAGLVDVYENKTLTQFALTFPDDDTTTLTLPQTYVTGFTPGAPVDGDLTASVKIKTTGSPTLV